MLTVAVHFRNMAPITAPCLQSVVDAVAQFGQPQDFEFILVDDTSDPGREVCPMLLEARSKIASRTRILRFTRHQHYTRACAHSFSMAQGDLLFVSPDMVITAECIHAMRRVASLDPLNGLVRACSNHVDGFPQHQIVPPLPLRDLRDVRSFSRYVAEHEGDTFVEDRLLTGDVMLIRRDVLDRVGAMDGRYYGYFGDVDYGLRVQLAGFRLVCAKGAWLYHEGASYYKNESTAKQIDFEQVHRNRMRTVGDAYRLFREKWDLTLPPEYPGNLDHVDFERLGRLSPPPFPVFEPPPTLTPDIGSLL